MSVSSLPANHLYITKRFKYYIQVAHPASKSAFSGMIRQQAQSPRKQRKKLPQHQPSHGNNKYSYKTIRSYNISK